MDAAYHAGGAVEMMAKAVVSHLDERLLADQDAGKHAFLELLAAHHDRADVGGRPSRIAPRSILAATAVALATRLSQECGREGSKAEPALRARNAASHMAEVDDTQLADVVTGMAAYVSAGVEAFEREKPDFWGSVAWDSIRRDLGELIRESRASVESKVAAAKSAHEHLVNGLPPEKLVALIADLQSRPAPAADDAWQVQCPACEYDGWLSWGVDYEPIQVGRDDWDYTGGTALLGFVCPVCGLDLTGDEVSYTDVDTVDNRDLDER